MTVHKFPIPKTRSPRSRLLRRVPLPPFERPVSHLFFSLSWEQPELIADPEAKKPEEWDGDMDGEWEAPMIANPDYKGEWKPKMIENPAYKGEWKPRQIDNKEFYEVRQRGECRRFDVRVVVLVLASL